VTEDYVSSHCSDDARRAHPHVADRQRLARLRAPAAAAAMGKDFSPLLKSRFSPPASGYLKSRHDDILIGAAGFIEYPTNVATLEKLLQEEYAREGAASAS